MKIIELPSLDYLKECFDLDEASPSGLRWRKRPLYHFSSVVGQAVSNGVSVGKVAGTLHTYPTTGKVYYRVTISGIKYYVHRIVYSMYNNFIVPTSMEIDHIDNIGTHNSISNLRIAHRDQNQHNLLLYRNNKSSCKGVFFCKRDEAWVGRVALKGKTYRTAQTQDYSEAVQRIKELRERLHGEFANHG